MRGKRIKEKGVPYRSGISSFLRNINSQLKSTGIPKSHTQRMNIQSTDRQTDQPTVRPKTNAEYILRDEKKKRPTQKNTRLIARISADRTKTMAEHFLLLPRRECFFEYAHLWAYVCVSESIGFPFLGADDNQTYLTNNSANFDWQNFTFTHGQTTTQ